MSDQTHTDSQDSSRTADLIIQLQAHGLRTEANLGARAGGAGPADAGMLWIDGVPATVPTTADYVVDSPYAMRQEDAGFAIYHGEDRLADARLAPRPQYYDMETADGVPYEKIALMHLDSMASTVLQTCTYWGTSDQCKFCGIGVTLDKGRTIAKKTPEMLAEVSVAAKELDGAVDATLTTGSTKTPDRGALYVGKCAHAVKEASGLPVQVQFEPPSDLDVINRVRDMGVDSVGIHIETFDPKVLADVAPGKARWGIESYFSAWERAVEVFGHGQVSTYVILGMGEDPDVTVAGAKRAIDLGVFPFVVPLRPVPGSLMEELQPPPPNYVERINRQLVPYMLARGMSSTDAMAGCARCQACSGIAAMERSLSESTEGRPKLPLFVK